MTSSQSIIFFDGACNLCNNFVQVVLTNEVEPKYQFCSLQSDFAIQFLTKNGFNLNVDSIIVYENNAFYIKSRAALSISSNLKYPFKLLSIFKFIPTSINDFFYDIIAKNRYKFFGKTKTCWVMKPEYKKRFLID
jgi:predicted DCC family thiol-disulfide oxidoreductase YuxK